MPVQEVIALIDRSGSMFGKEKDTVGGINAAFSEIRNNAGEDDTILISLKLFDHEQSLYWRSININEIGNFPIESYIPRGQTALLDTLGTTLTYFMEKKLIDPTAYDSCLIYIATDGQENASKQFTTTKIKELILNAEKSYNITVIYLGANQDAILSAGNIGIACEHAINYNENEDSINAVYRSAARVASESRTNRNVGFTNLERNASQVP